MSAFAYYNEIDPYAAEWLRNLISAGVLPPGDVDTRSIEDVVPNDLRGYTQCHFFAGIGGWAYALALAGWPASRPVWTGSCPCQPFSAAGKGAGFADERHLWPAWQHLIAQCQPPVIFGEQVASAAVGPWIDLVQADVENLVYAFGCEPFPAAGIGAPHIRDRSYWVADMCGEGLAQRVSDGRVQREALGARTRQAFIGGSDASRMANSAHKRYVQRHELEGASSGRQRPRAEIVRCGDIGRLADTSGGGRNQKGDRQRTTGMHGPIGDTGVAARSFAASPLHGFWADADWLLCTDGKWRPVEPGTFPLAHGVSNRVGRLRAYGNAIVPQQAAEFVMAYMEARGIGSAHVEVAA